MPDQPSCFVVMGYGEKTDPISGKTFDLDKSYRIVIEPAVKAAGATCVRAKDIVHAKVIDIPMYEHLLQADLVVADLSTLNPNAFFELGVRYALRPRATVVIAESGFRNPFNTSHIATLSYNHLGKGIDAEDAMEFRAKLTELCKTVLANDDHDSPVYTFIRDLTPPKAGKEVHLTEKALESRAETADNPMSAPLAVLMDLAMKQRSNDNFDEMRKTLNGIVTMMDSNPDPYAVQQLALATYKSKKPSPLEALEEGRKILSSLDPEGTNDPETLGIWGAIHKRLAELPERNKAQRSADLDTAIFAYEKGYYLKDDYYNGVNLAFLLNVRAARSKGDEQIADRVHANRLRRRLAERVERQIADLEDKETTDELREQAYWMRATMAEIHAGLQNADGEREWMDKARKFASESWMLTSTEEQIKKLRGLLVEPKATATETLEVA